MQNRFWKFVILGAKKNPISQKNKTYGRRRYLFTQQPFG